MLLDTGFGEFSFFIQDWLASFKKSVLALAGIELTFFPVASSVS